MEHSVLPLISAPPSLSTPSFHSFSFSSDCPCVGQKTVTAESWLAVSARAFDDGFRFLSQTVHFPAHSGTLLPRLCARGNKPFALLSAQLEE